MLFLLFLRGTSNATCDLVLYIFLEKTSSSFTKNGEVPFHVIKAFVAARCSTLSFIGRQFIYLNSLAPT